MITAISNILTNPTLVNIAQSTRTAMSIETGLKATGRPAFILMDKKISDDTKKYAATKEFLYQLTCLAVYMGLVLPVFRKCGFQVFKKYIFKDQHCFDKFRNLDEFSMFKKLKDLPLEERKQELQKLKDKNPNKSIFTEDIENILAQERISKRDYHMVKGADELSSIVGSVVGLAILAPQVSHVTIHPILKLLHMDKKQAQKEENNIDELA